jgi:hypothetical protein
LQRARMYRIANHEYRRYLCNICIIMLL